MKNKSLLFKRISDFADSKALRILNVEAFAKDLDDTFELEVGADGTENIIRRHTNQVVGLLDTKFIHQVLRPHVDNKSLGQFRSAFPERAPSNEEKSKVAALLDSSPTIFKNKEKESAIRAFILNNFVPSGNVLHRLAKGYVSKQSWTPDELLQHYGKQYISDDHTVLARLRKEAELKAEATYLASDPKQVNKVMDLLTRVNEVKFEEVDPTLFQKQQEDLKKKSYAYTGLISEKESSLAERNQAEVKMRFFEKEIEDLPTVPEL